MILGGEMKKVAAVWQQATAFGQQAMAHWLARFLLFGIPPMLVLVLMNFMWTSYIANLGCIGSGGGYRLELLFAPQNAGAPGCELPGGATMSADKPVRVAPPDQAILASLPARTDEREAQGPREARAPLRVAIAQGRFHWMAFHLVATVLFIAIAAVAVIVICRNLSGPRGWIMTAVGAAGGLGWAYNSLGNPTELRMDTASLLMPTRLHALSRFDASFQELAWNGVRWDYGGGLAVTILVVVAAASILADSGDHAELTRRQVEVKRRDLKLIIATAAVLMTFLALYVGEWLAWPAHFAPAADVRGSREEFREVATGLRLYFGTGYSLALIAFAVPAVLALPRAAPDAGTAQPRTAAAATGSDDGGISQEPAPAGYFQQFVFSKDELSMLISVMTPFFATLAGSALQL